MGATVLVFERLKDVAACGERRCSLGDTGCQLYRLRNGKELLSLRHEDRQRRDSVYRHCPDGPRHTCVPGSVAIHHEIVRKDQRVRNGIASAVGHALIMAHKDNHKRSNVRFIVWHPDPQRVITQRTR